VKSGRRDINKFDISVYKKLVISKSFTTERKRKASLILRRCLEFIYNRVLEGYRDEIPAKVFDRKFKEEIGWDRITLQKYLGKNRRRFIIDAMGRKVPSWDEHEPGAFEKFGLLERIPHPRFKHETLAWRILPYFWIKFREVFPQRKLPEWFEKGVPPAPPSQQYNCEGVAGNENISLISGVECIGYEHIEATANITNNTKETKQTNNNSERDIFYDKVAKNELKAIPEFRIFEAESLAEEPDRAKIVWSRGVDSE